MKKITLLSVLLVALVTHTIRAQYQYTNVNNDVVSKRYAFNIMFKDSTVKKVKSRIHYSKRRDSSYLKYKGEKIYPNQTVGISRDAGSATIAGYPNQNKWLFQVIRSNINCYSVYAEINTLFITHVQKSDEDIVYKLSNADSCQKALFTMMDDNKEAQTKMLKSIRAFKTRKIIAWCSFGSLGGVVGFSALSVVFPPAGYLGIGSLMLLPPSLFIAYPIVLNKPERRRWEAIKLYNKEN